MSLAKQLDEHDPKERLRQLLQVLDRQISQCELSNRPDGHAIAACVALGRKLLEEYHARAGAGVETVTTLDRAQAIAELRAVLAVWEDPAISDEAWLAARTGKAPAPASAGRGVIKRGRKTP